MLPTNANCIIYNDFGTGTSRRFIRHDIYDVYWDETKGQNVIRMGVTDASGVSMFVELKPDYITPSKWRTLTLDEAMTFEKFTLRKGDVIVLGIDENAPKTFTSTVQVQNYFGIDYAHIISSVDEKIMPNIRKTHHFEISGA